MMSRWVLLVCLATAGVTGCTAAELLGPDAPQGIDGVVLVGPQCPVQSQDDPCPDAPYSTTITVRTVAGREVTRVRSGDDGRFRVGLAVGEYLLDPESGNPFPVGSPQEVMVVRGVFAQVTVSLDSGIR